MGYRMVHTYLGTKKIHFPIEMDLKEDDKTMEYTVQIPEQRLKISMEFAFDEPVWVGKPNWDSTEESKPKEQKQDTKPKEQKQDNRELPMLGEAYW